MFRMVIKPALCFLFLLLGLGVAGCGTEGDDIRLDEFQTGDDVTQVETAEQGLLTTCSSSSNEFVRYGYETLLSFLSLTEATQPEWYHFYGAHTPSVRIYHGDGNGRFELERNGSPYPWKLTIPIDRSHTTLNVFVLDSGVNVRFAWSSPTQGYNYSTVSNSVLGTYQYRTFPVPGMPNDVTEAYWVLESAWSHGRALLGVSKCGNPPWWYLPNLRRAWTLPPFGTIPGSGSPPPE